MGSGFTFNSKDFEKQVRKATEGSVRDLAGQYERMFESLRRRYTGRPVDVIKPILEHEWKRINGGSITNPELTDYASLISEGTHIKMNVKM
ncbi:hypothetical protein [Arthrobacter sp. H5]|uniref:hypothetical protein n=1 Tax=Arthrobacter sp. H5 TaxID=1267973 RepID=UPI00047FCF2E|nr:hypothetical protein [Arthrobacter sp. H5]